MKRKNSYSNAIGMFDLAKGILMLCVLLVHSITDYFKYWEQDWGNVSWIYLLAPLKIALYGGIPMFFLIAGYGFSVKENVRCVKTRARYLLRPYVYVSAIILAVSLGKRILCHEDLLGTIEFRVIPFLGAICPGERSFYGIYIDSIGPVWFLITLLNAWILLNFIMNAGKEWLSACYVILCVVAGMYLSQNVFLPFCIPQSLITVGYLYAGYKIKQYRILENRVTVRQWIPFVLFALCVIPFGEVEVSQNVWRLGMLDWAAGMIIGSIFVLLSVDLNRFENGLTRKVRKIGKFALWILCVHTIEYTLIPWDKVADKFAQHKLLGSVTELVIRCVLVYAGCTALYFYNKWKRKRTCRKKIS